MLVHPSPLPLHKVLEDELLPSLRKLEAQVSQYHEYAVTCQAVERLKRFVVAHRYYSSQRWVFGAGWEWQSPVCQSLHRLGKGGATHDARLPTRVESHQEVV